jgi:hypothetical protein
MAARSNRRWTLYGSLASLAAAASWLAMSIAPVERPPQATNLKMHVGEIVPTDSIFREPMRAFNGGSVYWRVLIRDAQEQPVTGVGVHVDVVAPDGAILARLTAVTGGDGCARFTYPLRAPESGAVYTVRVADVVHTDPAAAYDRAANAASTTSFSVDHGDRPQPAPRPHSRPPRPLR